MNDKDDVSEPAYDQIEDVALRKMIEAVDRDILDDLMKLADDRHVKNKDAIRRAKEI